MTVSAADGDGCCWSVGMGWDMMAAKAQGVAHRTGMRSVLIDHVREQRPGGRRSASLTERRLAAVYFDGRVDDLFMLCKPATHQQTAAASRRCLGLWERSGSSVVVLVVLRLSRLASTFGTTESPDSLLRARQGWHAERKAMIDRTHPLPITRQAAIVNISRGSVYYEVQPVGDADLKLMRRIDESHLELPFVGARILRDLLRAEGNRFFDSFRAERRVDRDRQAPRKHASAVPVGPKVPRKQRWRL